MSGFLNKDGRVVVDKLIVAIQTNKEYLSDIDGLIGDRGTSYAWRMAQRGDDIYIATYRNLLNGVITLFEQSLAAQGISSEMVWNLANVITNGEIPKAEDTDGDPECGSRRSSPSPR